MVAGGGRARRMRAMAGEEEDLNQPGKALPYIASPGVAMSTVAATPSSVYHPLFGQDLHYSAQVVPDDPDEQVAATVRLMCQYAKEDATSPEIQREAQELIAQCGRDRLTLIRQVWWKVQKKIQFLRDESTAQPLDSLFNTAKSGVPIVEVLIRPRDMSAMQNRRVGDCDDYSMYCASLLIALGIDCSFVTIAGNSKDPDHFTHVYVAAYPFGFAGQRVAVDASHGPYCGWEGKKPGARCAEWKVSDGAGEPVDSIVGGVLYGVVSVGLLVGVVYWLLGRS